MNKSPIEMNYLELNELLDNLLKNENLPSTIPYRSKKINYPRRSKFFLLLKAFYRLIKAEMFYQSYIKKQLRPLKNQQSMYKILKETKCIRALKVYLYLAKIGLHDLLINLGSKFDNKIFTNFAVATMLYDASFDVKEFRHYLKTFDALIMQKKQIEPTDEYLKLFNDSINYLKKHLDSKTFETFSHYVCIEHISQLMSIYQLSDKKISKDDLLKITFVKGGISGLALMCIMAPNLKKEQAIAIYELGAVLQLIDDISDINEDKIIGIQTLPNQKLLDYDELKQMYCGTINNLIEKLNIDINKPNSSLDMLCWFSDSMLERRYRPYFKSL
ncbi:MAG: class 1 isoprenoid biosynthesis enzyme [Candidatus Thermoplasmatota archaeon]|nr:class 1 isoprenoid biosynthesis enzyme [Candidatus Thermoplasmatota archaeon]